MLENKTNTHEEELTNLSRAVIRTWTCACGHEVRAREWVIVDCLNRPDLVALIKKGSSFFPECPVCGTPVNSRMPFALARRAESVPLVLILERPKQELPTNLLAILDSVYGQLQREYGNFPRLTAPVTILMEIIERDIDADLDNNIPLLEAAEGDTYKNFLRIIKLSFDRDKRIRLIIELTGLSGIDDASVLLKRAPELFEPQMASLLEELGSGDSLLAGLHIIQKKFLEHVTNNLEIAFQTYIKGREEFFTQLYEPTEELRKQIELLTAQGKWQEVLVQAQRGLEFARISKNDFMIAEFSYNSANALSNLPAKSPQDIEQAVRYFEETLQTEVGRARAHVYLQLSTAYGSRSLGDPHENVERAIELAEKGLRMLDADANPDLWAMANTNLALQYFARDDEDRLDNLKWAAFLCEEALKIRSPERNADDWAYTMINLGLIKIDLLKLTSASLNPIENFQAVLAQEQKIMKPELLGRAHFNIGKVEVETAKAATSDTEALIQSAKKHLERSLMFHKNDPLLLAETHVCFAELAKLEGDEVEEEKQFVAALSNVSPDDFPEKYEAIASGAAARAVDAEEWPKAAKRYELALKAAGIRYEARSNQHRREKTLRSTSFLSRWTAAAFARCGDAAHAAEILESGKAHRLGVRVEQEEVDLQLLKDVLPELGNAYDIAVKAVAASQGEAATSRAVEDLNRVIAQIRAIDGMAGFLRREPLVNIEDAVSPSWPVVYLNPTPHGTLLLVAETSDDDEDKVEFHAYFFEVTSKNLIEQLMVSQSGSAYFSNIVGSAKDLKAIERGLSFVGEEVMRGVALILEKKKYSGVTIITSGPLSLLPVHAAQWQDKQGALCLGDLYSVTYAPSAHLAGICQKKWNAKKTRPPILVAVANPNKNDPLPHSEAEVSEIKAMFSDDSVHVRTKQRATVEFLENFATTATYLHLACHGKTELWDYRNSVIQLSNGEISVEEFAKRGKLDAQLSVASACQTAVLDQLLAEEGFSIGTALLAAGSAAAIATCWPVDDFPTALLMIRLYEILFSTDELRVCAALWQAQSWLRDLTQEELLEFVANHPALSVHPPSYSGYKPFASPYFWGAFVAMGG